MWQTCQQRWHISHRLLLTLPYGSRQGIIRQLALREDAIDDQLLIGKADGRQLVMGTRHFPQGRGLRPGNQNKPGFSGIGKGRNSLCVLAALFFQPGQWPQTGSIALPCARNSLHAPAVATDGWCDRSAPCRTRYGRIPHQAAVGQERGEFVKGGDLRGAGTGKLFFNAAYHTVGQLAAHRANDTFAIGLRGSLRSISSADNPLTAAMAVMLLPIWVSNTWPTFDAGSVLTSSTRLPLSHKATALAHASDVLPTPPLPVKKRNGAHH